MKLEDRVEKFTWEDTGESLADYRIRLKKQWFRSVVLKRPLADGTRNASAVWFVVPALAGIPPEEIVQLSLLTRWTSQMVRSNAL